MKKFFFGLILGVGLTFAVSVHAEVSTLVGKVVQGEVNVKLDGAMLDTKGAVIDGTTQMPLRELAESLGLGVTYDPVTGVELTTQQEEVVVEEEVEEVTSEPKTRRPNFDTFDDSVPIEKRLELIEEEMSIYNASILTNKKYLKDDGSTPDIEEAIQMAEEKLTELQAQKAELEAQAIGDGEQ